MVILDPVVAAVSGDSHKNTETRRGLQPVVDLADQLDCAVLGITHLSKNTGGREPLERVAGSIAFGAVARVVLATVKPADSEAPRRLVRAKSNLGPDTGGFEYTLFGAPVPGHDFGAQRVEWGEALEGTARELMAVEQPDDCRRCPGRCRGVLARHPQGRPRGHQGDQGGGQRPWPLAGGRWTGPKQTLGITATKVGFEGGWAWKLPEPNNAKNANSHAEERQHD